MAWITLVITTLELLWQSSSKVEYSIFILTSDFWVYLSSWWTRFDWILCFTLKSQTSTTVYSCRLWKKNKHVFIVNDAAQTSRIFLVKFVFYLAFLNFFIGCILFCKEPIFRKIRNQDTQFVLVIKLDSLKTPDLYYKTWLS